MIIKHRHFLLSEILFLMNCFPCSEREQFVPCVSQFIVACDLHQKETSYGRKDWFHSWFQPILAKRLWQAEVNRRGQSKIEPSRTHVLCPARHHLPQRSYLLIDYSEFGLTCLLCETSHNYLINALMDTIRGMFNQSVGGY